MVGIEDAETGTLHNDKGNENKNFAYIESQVCILWSIEK
jgi:hypothetical protein